MRVCDTCQNQYQDGPEMSEGHVIPSYGITVCPSCWTSDWDGWPPHYEATHSKPSIKIDSRSQQGVFGDDSLERDSKLA